MLRLKVLIRGAGEMASAIAHRLTRSGLRVLMTEVPTPMAVRRAVSYCEAVWEGLKEVEGVVGQLVSGEGELEQAWARGEAGVIVDPEMESLGWLKPDVVVDATLAKRNLGMRPTLARLTIGVGPGFRAPDDVHVVIESNRGHNLGRLIYSGEAEPNTGVPGPIAGYTHQRVMRAPAGGVWEPVVELGARVSEGQVVGMVGGQEVKAGVGGIVRGLLRAGLKVEPGTKLGDVDPRGRPEYLNTISEKARAIAGGVLEAIMAEFNR